MKEVSMKEKKKLIIDELKAIVESKGLKHFPRSSDLPEGRRKLLSNYIQNIFGGVDGAAEALKLPTFKEYNGGKCSGPKIVEVKTEVVRSLVTDDGVNLREEFDVKPMEVKSELETVAEVTPRRATKKALKMALERDIVCEMDVEIYKLRASINESEKAVSAAESNIVHQKQSIRRLYAAVVALESAKEAVTEAYGE